MALVKLVDKSPDELAFIRAIESDRESDTPRLVYADWLEDTAGRPEQAAFVRAQVLRQRLTQGQIDYVHGGRLTTDDGCDGWLYEGRGSKSYRWGKVHGSTTFIAGNHTLCYQAGDATIWYARGLIDRIDLPEVCWFGGNCYSCPELVPTRMAEGRQIVGRRPSHCKQCHGELERVAVGPHAVMNWPLIDVRVKVDTEPASSGYVARVVPLDYPSSQPRDAYVDGPPARDLEWARRRAGFAPDLRFGAAWDRRYCPRTGRRL